jgi:hypothetical protein
MNEVYLRDRRYDLVLHMVSAADGAENFYNLSNNIARYEVLLYNYILILLYYHIIKLLYFHIIILSYNHINIISYYHIIKI